MRKNILLLEDDINVVKMVQNTLEPEGFKVSAAYRAEDFLTQLRSAYPDLVILDLILPESDGLEVCRQLKADPSTANLPVLILSSRKEEIDVIVGLEIGAEDYIVKPFSPRILLTRVRTILKRNRKQQTTDKSEVIHYGDFNIDPYRFEVKCAGEVLTVTRSEFHLLHHLFSHPGRVFSRKNILESIHGEETPVTIRSVDVMIVNLRQKLGSYGKWIETIRGVGYRAKELPNATASKKSA